MGFLEVFSIIRSYLGFFLPLVIFIFLFYVVYLLIFSVGFKILKIKGISRSKVAVFIFLIFLVGAFSDSITSTLLGEITNRFALYFVNALIYFLITLLFLKYYFRLSDKKLWQFLLYLIILGLILSGLITLITRLSQLL